MFGHGSHSCHLLRHFHAHLLANLAQAAAGHALRLAQLLCQPVQDCAVSGANVDGHLVAAVGDLADGRVDLRCQVLGVARAHHAAVVDGDGADRGHAKLSHHTASHALHLLQISTGTTGDLARAEHDLLSSAAAKCPCDSGLQLVLRDEALILARGEPSEPLRLPARNDRELVHCIVVRQESTHQCVPSLVVGHQLLGGVVVQGRALKACDDPVGGVGHLLVGDGLQLPPCSQDGRLVHEVLEVRAAEADRPPGDILEVQVLGQLLVPHVHLQDLLAALDVRQADGDAPVEAAGPQQRVVEDVCAVRGRDDDDAGVALEAVHLSEDLVQSLLPLVVAATHACSALSADRVDLVDEDDARRLLLGLLEDVAHAGGANADEELDELGGGGLDEGDARLASQSLGHEGLASSRRSGEQDSLGNLCADLHESLWCLQEVDDLGELLLGFVDARHILELHTCLWGDLNLGPVLHAGHAWHASGARA
mmetsp:Transcript_39667/g.93470  ORF Transcript_39667/g.93470 Transcript_39667/m.93470 type:complete len:481 (-) Transcript_39667:1549-2991(-)